MSDYRRFLELKADFSSSGGITCELNSGYWRDGVGYLRAEERQLSAPSLFDLDDGAGAA